MRAYTCEIRKASCAESINAAIATVSHPIASTIYAAPELAGSAVYTLGG
jgi:hypothetical protein